MDRGHEMRETRENGLRSLLTVFLAGCLLASLAGVAAASDTGSEDEGVPTLMFFIMVGGTVAAVLIPLVVILAVFLSWVAVDYKSLQNLRSAGSLKKLRRIVVTPQEWWSIGEDGSNLKKELIKSGIKVRIQQVENNSPTMNALVLKENMDLPSAQTMEVARVRGLKYAWIDGRRVNAKDFLKRISNVD